MVSAPPHLSGRHVPYKARKRASLPRSGRPVSASQHPEAGCLHLCRYHWHKPWGTDATPYAPAPQGATQPWHISWLSALSSPFAIRHSEFGRYPLFFGRIRPHPGRRVRLGTSAWSRPPASRPGPNAEGVTYHSPRSAKRRSREAPPWVGWSRGNAKPERVGQSDVHCGTPEGSHGDWHAHPGCAATRRPWATLLNRFAPDPQSPIPSVPSSLRPFP